MGQDVDEKVKEIAATRRRLDDRAEQISRSLPAPARVARQVVVLAATFGGASVSLFMWLRRRRDHTRLKRIDKRLQTIEHRLAL